MITLLTIKDILEDTEYPDEPYKIYVIREDETILYIGKSDDPYTRLYDHFSPSGRGSGSGIGSLYKQYPAEAHNWNIDLYTLEDCKPYIQGTPFTDLDDIERVMIGHFKPCTNTLNNPDPSPLPDKYLSPSKDWLDDNAVDYIRL